MSNISVPEEVSNSKAELFAGAMPKTEIGAQALLKVGIT